jgi:hypothetical protein
MPNSIAQLKNLEAMTAHRAYLNCVRLVVVHQAILIGNCVYQ